MQVAELHVERTGDIDPKTGRPSARVYCCLTDGREMTGFMPVELLDLMAAGLTAKFDAEGLLTRPPPAATNGTA